MTLYYLVLIVGTVAFLLFLWISKVIQQQKTVRYVEQNQGIAKVYFAFREGKVSADQFHILAVNGGKPQFGNDVIGAFIFVPEGNAAITLSYSYIGLHKPGKSDNAYHYQTTEVYPIVSHTIYQLVRNPETNRPALQLING